MAKCGQYQAGHIAEQPGEEVRFQDEDLEGFQDEDEEALPADPAGDEDAEADAAASAFTPGDQAAYDLLSQLKAREAHDQVEWGDLESGKADLPRADHRTGFVPTHLAPGEFIYHIYHAQVFIELNPHVPASYFHHSLASLVLSSNWLMV